MKTPHANETLQRLLVLLSRSFPAYLTYATPYISADDSWAHGALDVMRQIVADQESLIERVAEAVYASGGVPQLGEFPMQFTDLHDLSVEYLVRVAIEYQRQDIASIEQCVDDLRLAPMARPLAEEALGMAKGHLEGLQELLHQPV